MSTVTDTVLATAEGLLPAILAAAGMANPAVASATQIAPLVLQALTLATAFQKAGMMTPEQLASAFAELGKSIQSTHNKWAAMNVAGQ